MKRTPLLTLLLLSASLITLSACGQTSAPKVKSSPSSSKVVYSKIANQTIRNALMAYPSLKAFNQSIGGNKALDAMGIHDQTTLIKLKNDGKKGGWLVVKLGTPANSVISKNDDGTPIKADDSRGATVHQIRQAFAKYKK